MRETVYNRTIPTWLILIATFCCFEGKEEMLFYYLIFKNDEWFEFRTHRFIKLHCMVYPWNIRFIKHRQTPQLFRNAISILLAFFSKKEQKNRKRFKFGPGIRRNSSLCASELEKKNVTRRSIYVSSSKHSDERGRKNALHNIENFKDCTRQTLWYFHFGADKHA